MATHFVCQSTEPLPHNFSAGPGSKTHGAVSQYEVYNAGRKPHTKFPPPGYDFSQTSDEDSLPLIHPAPEPEQRSTSFVYDTDLCVTPQRSNKSTRVDNSYNDNIFRKPDAKPDPGLELTPMKAFDDNISANAHIEKGRKQKVRFDIDDSLAELNSSDKVINASKKTSPVKPYQPELYEDDDCDFEIEKLTNVSEDGLGKQCDVGRTVKYNVVNNTDKQSATRHVSDGNSTGTNSMSQDTQSKSSMQTIPKTQIQKTVKVVREKTEKLPTTSEGSDKVDPVASCWVHESSGGKRKVKVLRDNQYHPGDTECSYPFKENPVDDYAGDEEHMFARPEYNSTLRMKLEAERLKESSIDIETALKRKLQLSESVKAEMNEKVANLVNTDGPAFSGLISLKVPADEICKQAAEQKTMRAKQVKLPKSKFKSFKEPDLMEFFSDDRQKESVSFSIPGIPAPSELLATASHWGAFDLYKHNRVWDRSRKN